MGPLNGSAIQEQGLERKVHCPRLNLLKGGERILLPIAWSSISSCHWGITAEVRIAFSLWFLAHLQIAESAFPIVTPRAVPTKDTPLNLTVRCSSQYSCWSMLFFSDLERWSTHFLKGDILINRAPWSWRGGILHLFVETKERPRDMA